MVESVLLHDDLLAWVTQPPRASSSSSSSNINGALVLAWCQALGAALGCSGDAGGSGPREAKAQAAMGTVIGALLGRVRALLSSPAPEGADALADALDGLLALGCAGRRAALEAVLTGALALLREQQQQQPAANAATCSTPLVTLIAALAAVDVWGAVEAALLGPSSETLQLLLPPRGAGTDGQGSMGDDNGGRELAAVVALLRAARGTAADQQPVLALFMGSVSSAPKTTAPDAMEVDGQGQGQASLFPACTPALAASGWGRYRLAREAFLHGYFPLAHRWVD